MLTPGIVAAAIAAGEMELFLQPIVSAADNTVTRAEGLIRWRHPLAGLIAPDDFVPLAEQDQSVIDQLTRWVIAAGVEQHRKLAELGFAVQVCVNVSGRNLRSLDFPDQVAALLETASAPPHAIALEVTESAATSDLRATADVLTRLRLKGLPLAIDDFGTGHSSLAALRDMPFSTVKIDKSFVRDLRQSRDSLIIVQSIIDLARNLRLACVAEGVEEAEIARQLVANGIGALQGFYYSPPLPFDAFVSWLRAWSGNAFKPQQMVEVSTL
jgi:EAL domain-containing protein (putative c-di-GMP-specific phosphodiesterase class I)